MSIKSLWRVSNAFYFLEKSSFIFKTIMVSVFRHIFILLNIFLKMELAFPVSAVTITIPEYIHTHIPHTKFPLTITKCRKADTLKVCSYGRLVAHYENPPNKSYLNLLQPGPILQQSCLGLQIMSWFCSLLSLRHICVKKGEGGTTCFTSIDRKKLVTTSFLLQFRFLTFFLKN